MDIVTKALRFAAEAHGGQRRKYNDEPYINHPISVCELVKTVNHNEYMLAAALLHDTVEDTKATIADIKREFGDIVSMFVSGLTDVSKPEDGNRSVRKELDRQHLKNELPPIHTIKLADLIDNSKSIIEHDPKFSKIYMAEKKLLLEVLTDGDRILFDRAANIVNDFYS